MTQKYSNQITHSTANRNMSIGKIFPSYGLGGQLKTTRKEYDVDDRQLRLEASNHDKIFFKQKFFMKDFMEELLRSNVNPNKRS